MLRSNVLTVLGAAVALALAAGCFQPEESAGPTVGLSWREHPFLGAVLADPGGRTLYVFADDAERRSACVDACARTWPPAEGPEAAADAALAARLSTIERADGARQLAIDGRPLYRYSGDAISGDATGQGRNLSWFVVRESERPGARNVDFLDGPGAFETRAEPARSARPGEATSRIPRPADRSRAS